MTITRLGQLSAELNTTEGIALYAGGSNYPGLSTTKYKTGARSYRSNLTTGDGFGMTFPATTAIRAGFWINHGGGDGTPTLFTIQVGSALVRVTWAVVGNYLRLYMGYDSGTTTFYQPLGDTDAGTFSTTDAWKHIGVTYKCDAVSGFVSVYLDGTKVLSVTGDTTVYAANGVAKQDPDITGLFALGYYSSSYWNNYAYVDDVYVDSFVGEADVAPSGKRFLFSLADADGAHTDWTPLSSTNISNVDDPVSSANDGDTTYVKALAADLVDTYTTANVTVPADHIVVAVIPVAMARKTDSTDCTLILVADDTTDQALSAAKPLATAYAPVWARMATQPDGATAWDETTVNACEFGFKSAGTFA